MTPRPLHAVLRTLAAAPPASDADLLGRFMAGDEAAFADLVARHGRLVWGVCRNLTRSDAEADDAFQATFLVLLKRARAVRDAGKLSAWLHGVAYRVCAKARQAAKLRAARERAAAAREGNGAAVPESAWDRALAAVHEEVARLPDPLRVPFVLCCLEGRGQTEAAGQLGWRLSTLADRLARPKDAVIARLDARGVTLGVLAAGLAAPPPAALARASAMIHPGATIPGSVLQLSKGVCVMGVSYLKVLAAGLLVAAGVGAGFGPGWLATADAQPPGKPPQQPAATKYDEAKRLADLEAQIKRLQDELDATREQARRAAAVEAEEKLQARRVAEDNEARARTVADRLERVDLDRAGIKTAKWEYDLADQEAAYEKGAFERFLQQKENDGWEFLGSTTGGPSGGKHQWLFRRPARTVGAATPWRVESDFTNQPRPPGNATPARGNPNGAIPSRPGSATPPVMKPDDAGVVQDEIDRLEARLKQLRAKAGRVVFPTAALSLPPKQFAEVLARLADDILGQGKLSVSSSDHGVAVEGDREALEWAAGLVKTLKGKPGEQPGGKPPAAGKE